MKDNNKNLNSHFEYQYAKSIENLINIAESSEMQIDRTNTGTFKRVGQHFEIDLELDSFPILHGKKLMPKNALIEMLWFLNGDTNIKYLKDNGVNYWDEWADKDGMLGRIYGKQFVDFNGVNQLKNLIDILINNFESRRALISLWNVNDLDKMNLPPCHFIYQLVGYEIDGKRYTEMVGTMRSGDSFLGIPYNFMLFTIFGEIINYYLGYTLKKTHVTIADYHLYSNHIESAKTYVNNVLYNENDNNKFNQYVDKSFTDKPKMVFNDDVLKPLINEVKSSDNFIEFIKFLYDNPQHITFENYGVDDHEKFIKAKIAV